MSISGVAKYIRHICILTVLSELIIPLPFSMPRLMIGALFTVSFFVEVVAYCRSNKEVGYLHHVFVSVALLVVVYHYSFAVSCVYSMDTESDKCMVALDGEQFVFDLGNRGGYFGDPFSSESEGCRGFISRPTWIVGGYSFGDHGLTVEGLGLGKVRVSCLGKTIVYHKYLGCTR